MVREDSIRNIGYKKEARCGEPQPGLLTDAGVLLLLDCLPQLREMRADLFHLSLFEGQLRS